MGTTFQAVHTGKELCTYMSYDLNDLCCVYGRLLLNVSIKLYYVHCGKETILLNLYILGKNAFFLRIKRLSKLSLYHKDQSTLRKVEWYCTALLLLSVSYFCAL